MKSHLEVNAVEKVKASLLEGTSLLFERQKLILLADKSEFGWKTVEEYTQHELAQRQLTATAAARRSSTLQYGPQNSCGLSALGS